MIALGAGHTKRHRLQPGNASFIHSLALIKQLAISLCNNWSYNMTKIKNLAALGTAASIMLFSACSAIQVKPGAERILVSKNAAPEGCKFLGLVVGSQGGAFSGGWTSNKNMSEGAMNDLKNKALALGGNYVQIETDRAGTTMSGGGFFGSGGISGQQTDVTLTGNAYKCDPVKLGLN